MVPSIAAGEQRGVPKWPAATTFGGAAPPITRRGRWGATRIVVGGETDQSNVGPASRRAHPTKFA